MGATNYTLALEKRYSRLTGQLEELRANIERIKSEHKKLPEFERKHQSLEILIQSVATLLKEEDVNWEPALTPPIKPWSYSIPIPFGSVGRRGHDVLRRAEVSLTVREIAQQVLREVGCENPSRKILERTTNTIGVTLHRYEGRTVERSGKYPARWRVIHKPYIDFGP